MRIIALLALAAVATATEPPVRAVKIPDEKYAALERAREKVKQLEADIILELAPETRPKASLVLLTDCQYCRYEPTFSDDWLIVKRRCFDTCSTLGATWPVATEGLVCDDPDPASNCTIESTGKACDDPATNVGCGGTPWYDGCHWRCE